MKTTKIISFALAIIFIFCALATPAFAMDPINFIPEISGGRLYGTALETSTEAIRALFFRNDVVIYDASGMEVSKNEEVFMGTGFTVQLNQKKYYSVIVMGDINGDGKLTMTDYALVKRAYHGTYSINGLSKTAAGVEPGETLRPIHYIKVKRAYFGTYDINKKYTCEPYDPSAGSEGWFEGWV